MLEQKLDKLFSLLRQMETVAVCFSGGTDSTFLAMAVAKALKPGNFTLFHISSEMTPNAETAFAGEWAAANALPLEVLKFAPLQDENVVRNDINRCYYCKKIITGLITKAATAKNLAFVIDGLNKDDLDDYRPGTRAADENGVRHPLLEAGLGKAEIRELAARWQLPNWNLLPSACLASRLPYGMKLTAERLRMVEEGEKFLRQLGYSGCRVRFSGENGARIELQPEDIASAAQNAEKIVEKLRTMGFKSIVLDLVGYTRGGGYNPK